jgi:mutator protein MutT
MPAPAASYRPHVGVHLILTEGRKVLLLRRANTGFADGSWSVPGGSLEDGETLPAAAVREAREEVGVVIDPADLIFAHLCHHADPDGLARIGVFFAASRWAGEPVNAEPHKCSEIAWHELGDLPGDVVGYIRAGLNSRDQGMAFSLDGWQATPAPRALPSTVRQLHAGKGDEKRHKIGTSRWRDSGHLQRAVETVGGQESFDAAVDKMLDDARNGRLAGMPQHGVTSGQTAVVVDAPAAGSTRSRAWRLRLGRLP